MINPLGSFQPCSKSGRLRRPALLAALLISTLIFVESFALVKAEDTASVFTWDDKTLAIINSGNSARGQVLGVQCKACHDPSISNGAGLIPRLAGMNPRTIYKQLEDFKNNRRSWRDMTQIARLLSQQDMADLAAYWAAQSEPAKALSDQSGLGAAIVNQGLDQKSVPACSACHNQKDNELGAPPLAGQKAPYLEHQLASFANGTRHNDLDGVMRDIAGHLTPEERQAVAGYYGRSKP